MHVVVEVEKRVVGGFVFTYTVEVRGVVGVIDVTVWFWVVIVNAVVLELTMEKTK